MRSKEKEWIHTLKQRGIEVTFVSESYADWEKRIGKREKEKTAPCAEGTARKKRNRKTAHSFSHFNMKPSACQGKVQHE